MEGEQTRIGAVAGCVQEEDIQAPTNLAIHTTCKYRSTAAPTTNGNSTAAFETTKQNENSSGVLNLCSRMIGQPVPPTLLCQHEGTVEMTHHCSLTGAQ